MNKNSRENLYQTFPISLKLMIYMLAHEISDEHYL